MTELCTESSHINPLLGLGLLLSLPSMSFSLFFLCLCHSVGFAFIYFIFFAYFFFFFFLPLSLCLPLTSSLLSVQSLFITDIPLPRFIVLASHWYMCNWLPLCPESAPLTSTGGKCHSGLKTSGNKWKEMEVKLQGWVVLCVFVSQESQERLKRGESERDWVSGYSDGTESLFQDSGDR